MRSSLRKKDGDALLPHATPAGALRKLRAATLHAGEGLGSKLAPPRSQGLKVLAIATFPPYLFAVKKLNLAVDIWAPVEGL